MAKKPGNAAATPPARKARREKKVPEPLSLKELRKSAKQTQADLARALGVGQDAISRLEKRSDMLLSTLRHYVESIGGQLTLLATLPERPPMFIDPLLVAPCRAPKKSKPKRRRGRTASDA